MNSHRSALLGLALLLTVSAAPARAQRVRANVPFDFVVGSQVLPAGEYVLSSEGSGNLAISIRSTEGHGTLLATTYNCSNSFPAASTRLVFQRVGGRYFLSQIWASGYSSGRQLPKTAAEAEIAKSHEAAKKVLVAAKLMP